MATTITTYFPDEPMPTSGIPTVAATTDSKKVAVTVTRNPDDEIDVFYRTSLYAFNGVVELTGLDRLVEENFRAAGLTHGRIEVAIDSVTTAFTAIYCEHEIEGDFHPEANFLSAAATSVVHLDSTAALTHWPDAEAGYRVRVVGIDAAGRAVMTEALKPDMSADPHLRFKVRDLIAFALDNREMQRPVYFAIDRGRKQKLFYLAEDGEYRTFRFRNKYNAIEYIDVTGTVTRKTKADRDTAVCGGRQMQFNRNVSRTYEVQTAALSADQAEEIEQLATSHHAELCTAAGVHSIIVTDHTCEQDNNDASLISMKFTFSLAGSRPTDFEATDTPQIFNAAFTPEFT